MTNRQTSNRTHRVRRLRRIPGVLALVGTLAAAMPVQAYADRVTPPAVPGNLTVPAGQKPFLQGHAIGTQNYECRASGSGYTWTFTGPQASLATGHGSIDHFLSANPDEGGTARATWRNAPDQSTVWARMVDDSDDPAYVAAGAIPWLVLRVVGAEDGPDGGDRLSQATYIHRVNTTGGRAPATGCDASTAGAIQAMPYTADYFFYKDAAAE